MDNAADPHPRFGPGLHGRWVKRRGITWTRWEWAQCTWCWRWEYGMYIRDDRDVPLCDLCNCLEQCIWCWRWGNHYGPLCAGCLDLEEPSWWPNHRQRCELFVWRMFGNGVNHRQHRVWAPRRLELHWDLCCAIASFVSKPWLP